MSEKVKVGPLEWTVWPTQFLPTEEWLRQMAGRHGPGWVLTFHQKREQQIRGEEDDPLRFGWEAPPLEALRQLIAGTYVPGRFGIVNSGWVGKACGPADDVLLMTGNRFGKSRWCARFVIETMMQKPNARVRCWSQNQMTSRAEQQYWLYRHLPPQLRGIKKQGQFCKISYTAATGFSEETFLFPQPGGGYAQCWLFTYHAWQQDKRIAEGGEADLIWCDEEVPAELLDTLRFRTGAKRMLLLVSFTPLTGYTDAVAQYIEGAEWVECVPARKIEWDWLRREWRYGDWLLDPDRVYVHGLPAGHVPFLLRHPKVEGRWTLCAGTVWNPYIALEDVLKRAEHAPVETKLIRWFGWPTNKVQKAFPLFGRAHIVPEDRVPPESEMTIWHFVDPHAERNWFMLWIGVTADGRIWVIDEWPDASLGEWALPGSEPDGRPGPAQTDGAGRGFDGYKLLILEKEGWREGEDGVWKPGPKSRRVGDGCRYLDPRAASWKVPSQNEAEAKSYIECLAEPVRRAGKQIAPGLDFQRAPACHILEGNELINDWITSGWDPRKPLDPENCPRFYVSERCQNTIWALRTFTGRKKSGRTDEDSACKDPIDCLKAAAKLGIRYIAPGELGSYGGWGGY